MKDIDNIVRLYEAIEDKEYYWFSEYGGLTVPMIFTTNINLFNEAEYGDTKLADRNIWYMERGGKWHSQATTRFLFRKERDFTRYDVFIKRRSLTTIPIEEKDVDVITKNNIFTIAEYKKYKASHTIKNPDSTMMDVLCAFGDL